MGLSFRVLLVAFLMGFSCHIFAQGVKGIVTNDAGEPIPFTTIYLKKTTSGTTTNQAGEYAIFLEKGNYNIVFQALGFQRQELNITVGDAVEERDVVLEKQAFRIKEVRVYSGGEDPAYPIMRKAISLAPYYLRQAGSYQAEVYLKGTLKMKKIPKLLAKAMEVEGELVKAGETYTSESMSRIRFEAPDKYDHKVVSSRSTFPGDDDASPMGYITSSFYESGDDMVISPLAPNAFAHYKFMYEGFFMKGLW